MVEYKTICIGGINPKMIKQDKEIINVEFKIICVDGINPKTIKQEWNK